MKKGGQQRLDRLAVVWPPATSGPTTNKEASWWWYLSTPARLDIIRTRAEERAMRRFYAERGTTEARAWRDWYGFTEEEQAALALREVDDLGARQRDLGPELGWETWTAEAAAWSSEPFPLDQATFDRALARRREGLDSNRRGNAGWRAAHPGWREGMTPEEHDTFELTLVAERRAWPWPFVDD